MDNSPLSSISVASNQSPVSVGDNSFEFSVDAETLSPNATTVANDTIDSNSPLTPDSEATFENDYDSFATPEQENDDEWDEEWDEEWNDFLNDDEYVDFDPNFDDLFGPHDVANPFLGGSRRKAKKTSKKKKPARRMRNSTKKLKGKKPSKTRSHKKSRKNCRHTRRRQQRLVR